MKCTLSRVYAKWRLLPLQEEHYNMTSDRLTDVGTAALGRALSAGDPADRPTLERLHLNKHPGIGAATAVALVDASLRSLSVLSLMHGGAPQ